MKISKIKIVKRFNYVCIFLFIMVSVRLTSQNVGINNIEPLSTLDVAGSIRVQSPITFSSATPTPAQIYTMNNTASIQNIPSADSVFRVLDPGTGPILITCKEIFLIVMLLGVRSTSMLLILEIHQEIPYGLVLLVILIAELIIFIDI